MRVSREFRSPFLFILFIACCIGLFVIFIPPVNIGFILGFLFLIWLLVYSVFRIWLRKRYSMLLSFFCVSLLLLKAFGVFDTINAILLVSLFVGLFSLLK